MTINGVNMAKLVSHNIVDRREQVLIVKVKKMYIYL